MAKQSKKNTSASNKQYFASYNGEKQREKRLNRHMKKHPNDAQAQKAKPTYRRKAPQNKGGWLTREMAQKVYMGFTPKKDEDAVMIMNCMKPSDRVKMAYFASELKSIRNRLQFKETVEKIKKLGYAG